MIEVLIINNSCNLNVQETNYNFDFISNMSLIKDKIISNSLTDVNLTDEDVIWI